MSSVACSIETPGGSSCSCCVIHVLNFFFLRICVAPTKTPFRAAMISSSVAMDSWGASLDIVSSYEDAKTLLTASAWRASGLIWPARDRISRLQADSVCREPPAKYLHEVRAPIALAFNHTALAVGDRHCPCNWRSVYHV